MKHNGAIYAAYHCPTGKWYVGQTINTIAARAKNHWHSRRRATDHLHLTLADDPDPMCLLFIALEHIPKVEWEEPAPRQQGYRKRELARFRAVATPRERFWVDKLRSMWPKGWNSQYPGKPAASNIRPPPAATPNQEPARDIQAALEAIRTWTTDPHSAQRWLQGAAREDLTEILEGLEKNLPPSDRTATTAALAAEVRDVLRRRKVEKKPRDFVRLLYGNRHAASVNLPDLLRSPEIYKLHPEPDVGAAIMVVHRFAPQIASELFNYSDWSTHPEPLDIPAASCPCHGQVHPDTPLVEGHVLATDPAYLKSPYLRDILAKGKKYRLQQPLASILPRLQDGITQYIDYKMKAKRDDYAYAAALERWASAVMAGARARLSQAAINQVPEPDGYPGLKEQLRAAKNALVFGPEDRAPHAMFFACGRLYSSKLLYRLEDSGAFIVDNRDPAAILQHIKQLNELLKAEHHDRLPYLYGSWKAKKGTFRWIAGTSRKQDPPAGDQSKDKPKEEGAPKNALTDAASAMVPVWQHIFKSLRSMDLQRRARGQPARYWIVEDIDEFVQEFRANAALLATVPWATYDFTTMYEALEHPALIEGCMTAASDAWEHERNQAATASGTRPDEVDLVLSTKGWAKKVPEMDNSPVMWYTTTSLRQALTWLLDNLYIRNGDVLRKQVKGVPMGLNCSGQLANAYGYAIESRWVDATPGPPSVMSRRYIDDIIVAGPKALTPGEGLPSEALYKMKYKLTSESTASLIYIGVRFFVDEKGEAHTVLHDRAVDYPIRVDRYPEASTVANPAQLGGVIMGRLVAAQRTCSRLDLFQDAVAGIMTHAHNRSYPRRLMHSVWTRFLTKYWDAASVTTRELREWFHKAWNQVTAAAQGKGTGSRPTGQPRQAAPMPAAPLHQPTSSTSDLGGPHHLQVPPLPMEPVDFLLEAMDEMDEDVQDPPPPSFAAEEAIAAATMQCPAAAPTPEQAPLKSLAPEPQAIAPSDTGPAPQIPQVPNHAPAAPPAAQVLPPATHLTVVISPQMHMVQQPAATHPQSLPVYIPIPIPQLGPPQYHMAPPAIAPPSEVSNEAPAPAGLILPPEAPPQAVSLPLPAAHGEGPDIATSSTTTVPLLEGAPPILAIEWPYPSSMEQDRPQLAGKRRLAELTPPPSQEELSQQPSQSLSQGPAKRPSTMADWPEDWKTEWRHFKTIPDVATRRQRWATWPAKMKSRAPVAAGPKLRPELRDWLQEELLGKVRVQAAADRSAAMRQASISSPPTTNAQNSARHLAPEDIEPTSHVWTEGARIGEATNPGPAQSHRTTGNQAIQNGAGTASFHHCIRHGMVDGLGLNEAGCLCWHRFGVSDPGAPASGRTSPTKRQGHPRRSHDMVDGLNPNEAGCLCKHCFGAIDRSGPGALTSGRSSPTKSQGHLLLPLPHPWPPCPIIIQATPRPGPVVDLCQDGDIHPNPGPPKRRPNDTFQSTNASQNHRPSATSQHRHRQEPSGSRMPRDWTSHCKMLSELYGAWMASTAPRNPNTMKSNSAGMPGNDGPFAVEDLHPVWPAGSQPRSQQPTRGGPSGVRTDRQCGVDRHAVNRQTSSRPMGRGSQEARSKPAGRGMPEQGWRTAPQPNLDRAMA